VLLYDSSLAVGADHFGAMYGVPICLAALFAWRELSPRWCALLGLLLAAAALVKETTALLLAPVPVLVVAVRLVQLLVSNYRARDRLTPRYDFWRGPLLAVGLGLACSAPLWLTNWILARRPGVPDPQSLFARSALDQRVRVSPQVGLRRGQYVAAAPQFRGACSRR